MSSAHVSTSVLVRWGALALCCGVALPALAQSIPDLKRPDYTSDRKVKKLKLSALEPQVGHSRKITSLTFSSDGALVATASGLDDGLVKLWDTATGKVLHTIYGEDHVSFSVDGKILASGNVGGPTKLWDVVTGKLIKTIPASGPLAFTPDGQHLVAEDVDKDGGDGKLAVWSTKDWTRTKSLEGHKASFVALSVSKDGRFVATASMDESVKLWDLKSMTLARTIKTRTEMPSALALSPDAETLAISYGGKDNTIEVWDVSASKKQRVLKGHTKNVVGLDWTPDGESIVSGGLDGATKVWDAATGSIVRDLKGGGLVKVSPDGAFVAHGEQAVELLDAKTAKVLRTFKRNDSLVYDAIFSEDGATLMTTDTLHTVDLWSVKTGKWIKRVTFANGTEAQPTGELVFSDHGKYVALRPYAGNAVVVFDAQTGSISKTITAEGMEAIRDVTFSPDQTQVVIEGRAEDNDDKTVLLWWDIAKSQSINQTKVAGFARVHGFTDGGKNVAVISHGTRRNARLSVRTWMHDTGMLKRVAVKDVVPYAGDVRFGYNTPVVALGDEDNTVKVINRDTGEVTHVLKAHTQLVDHIAFSEDDALLATASWDESVKVWDVKSGKALLNIDDVHYKAQSLTFSPNHKHIAVSHKGWARLINVQTGQWRDLYTIGDGWLVHDSKGRYDCDKAGCPAVVFRDDAGAVLSADDKIDKALKGVQAM